jgi:hypothetical protein
VNLTKKIDMIKFEFWIADTGDGRPLWLAHSIVADNLDIAKDKLARVLCLDEITQTYLIKAIEVIIPL